MSVKSVLHKLIDDVHRSEGHVGTAQDLHVEVDEPDVEPDVPEAEKEGE